jgi:hypothetical protein
VTAGHQSRSIEHAVDEMAVAHAPSTVTTDVSRTIPDVMTSPLALDGWLEFNRVRWGAQPLRVRLSEDDSEIPAVHAVYYLNQKVRRGTHQQVTICQWSSSQHPPNHEFGSIANGLL